MSKIFFISDTHFNHSNIIEYCNRPFNTIEQMNQTIIENWNNTVSEDDIVYFLGDFCLGNRETIKNFASKLKGHKILITGNHDRSENLFLEAGFEKVYKKRTNLDYNGVTLRLSHKPEDNFKGINIHGHIHNLVVDNPKYFNVSVERINYTPILLEDVIEKIQENIAEKNKKN